MEINKKLLPMKAHYFLFNAGTAPVVPYMPTLARQLGFSSVVVGTMYTILPIIGMIAKPSFGAIADRFQRQKLLFMIFQVLTLAFFMIMFIPAIPQESKATFYCNDGLRALKYCPGPNDDPIKECSVQNIESTHGNDTLRCDLTCATTDTIWTTICDRWTVPLLCKDQDRKKDLIMGAEIQFKHLMVLPDSCLHVIVGRGEFPQTGEVSDLTCPAGNQTTLPQSIKTQCDITCNNAELNALLQSGKIPDDQVTGHFQFWAFFLCLITSWVGMAVVVTVGDAICFEMLEDKPHLYGNQRLWGAVGWGSVSLVSGLLVDEFSKGKTYKDYSVLFYMMLILILLDMLVSKKLKYSQTKMSTNIMRDVGTLLKSFRVVVFLGWCVVVGLCTALIWNFLFWHLEDLAAAEKGCDYSTWIKTLQGLAMAIQCFGGELPFFFLSGWILKKIGHINAMSLVLAGFALRFFLYSILTNPWWVLPIELLNGVTFGVFYSTMASYASIVAPPGTEATIQGLVGAVFEGVGVSLGSLIAGLLFNNIGGSATFRLFGMGAMICLVVHVIVQKVYARFAGSFGKAGSGTDAQQRPNKVVYIAGSDTNGQANDDKNSIGDSAGGASRILLSEDEAGFREISLK